MCSRIKDLGQSGYWFWCLHITQQDILPWKIHPNRLLLSHNPKVSIGELLTKEWTTESSFNSSYQGEEFAKILKLQREQARDTLVLSQEHQAKAFNKNRQLVEEINLGDLVLVNLHTLKLVEVEGTGRKLVQHMIGPFKVIEHINPNVYQLRLPDFYPMHLVINIKHLKKYKQSLSEFTNQATLPSTQEFLASEEYKVEAILGHWLTRKKRGNQRMFRVQGPDMDQKLIHGFQKQTYTILQS